MSPSYWARPCSSAGPASGGVGVNRAFAIGINFVGHKAAISIVIPGCDSRAGAGISGPVGHGFQPPLSIIAIAGRIRSAAGAGSRLAGEIKIVRHAGSIGKSRFPDSDHAVKEIGRDLRERRDGAADLVRIVKGKSSSAIASVCSAGLPAVSIVAVNGLANLGAVRIAGGRRCEFSARWQARN